MRAEKAPRRKSWYLLWGILLAAVFWVEKLPSTEEQCIIRAAVVQMESGCTVGLLYQQPAEAADSADAVEQMRIAWGEGGTLAAAYTNAERELPGTAVYKLCDSILLCGSDPLKTMDPLRQQIETDGCGRLSAYTAVWAGSAESLRKLVEETDGASELSDKLESVQANAPRLYQDGREGILFPYLQGNETEGILSDGILFAASDKRIHLTETGGQIAQLLYDHHACMTLETENGSRAVIRAVTSEEIVVPARAILRVTGFVSGTDGSADTLAHLKTMLQQYCLAVWQQTGTAQMDLPGTQALFALRSGGRFEEAIQRECYVQLWMLP